MLSSRHARLTDILPGFSLLRSKSSCREVTARHGILVHISSKLANSFGDNKVAFGTTRHKSCRNLRPRGVWSVPVLDKVLCRQDLHVDDGLGARVNVMVVDLSGVLFLTDMVDGSVNDFLDYSYYVSARLRVD